MKQILLFVIICFSLHLHAQTSKGSFLIGSNFFISHDKTESRSVEFNFLTEQFTFANATKTTALGLNPKVGYFLIERLCIGATLPFSFSNSKTESQALQNLVHLRSELRTRNHELGPFIRYYIPLPKSFSLLTEASYGWGYSKTNYSQFNTTGSDPDVQTIGGKISQRFTRFGAGAGLAFFLNSNIGLELLGTYSKESFKEDEDTGNTGLKAEIGIQFYLSK